jgi:CDGSH-type Zn-finger protein
MPRLVKRARQEPYAISVGGETQYICGCGLSGNLPYCDGTHEATADEDPTKLYRYRHDGEREETPDVFPDMRSDTPEAVAP